MTSISIIPARELRLTTTSLSAARLEDGRPRRTTLASMQRPVLDLEVAFEDRVQRFLPVGEGDVGDEAEAAEVDADDRQAERRERAGDAQHGAVAAHDDAEFGAPRQRLQRPGATICLDQDVIPRRFSQRAIWSRISASPSVWGRPNRAMVLKRAVIRRITP